MGVTFDVVSIGCLSRNPMWNEKQPVRAAHATTTVVRDGPQVILVDPSLPGELLEHRLFERTGLKPAEIDVVFLTSWRPVHRRSLELFERADWLICQQEREAMQQHLEDMVAAAEAKQAQPDRLVADELKLLRRCRPAPDKITPQVHLFPSPGVTPGTAGLLLGASLATVIIAGDAVISRGYFERGRVYEECFDVEASRRSMEDILEIADQIVPGHDNVFVSLGRG